MLFGIQVAIANAAGLISTNVFRAKDEPKYVPALITSGVHSVIDLMQRADVLCLAVFGAFCLVLVARLASPSYQKEPISMNYFLTNRS